MALDANDIAAKRAAIPDRFQPPPNAGGRLSSYFLSVDSLRESTPLQGRENAEREKFNIGMRFATSGDDQAAPSIILSGAAASARKVQIEKRNEEHRRDERTAVERAISQLNERIAAMDAQIAALDQDLRRIAARRAAIGEQLNAIDDIEELRRKGIKLDPSNPAHAKLLRASGLSASEINDDNYLAVLLRKRAGLSEEDSSLALDQDSKIKRRDQLTLERNEALTVRNALDGASTDEARIMAQRRAATLLGRDQLSTVAYDSTSASVKAAAADAIASNEREDRRADSRAYDRAVIKADDTIVLRTDTNSFKP